MKRSPQPRKATRLSGLVRQPLDMYALAASSAGVGLLRMGAAIRGEDRVHARLSCHRTTQQLSARP